ncbi:MAG TPA: hypothetical protein VHY48_06855 [Acidobacteriaceae bacterium]|jgi:hypothetical protein|nr:hypothetical protein [Acidobacteriaceae bacterium]
MRAILLLAVAAVGLSGCAMSPTGNCNVTLVMLVSPVAATADHAANPPGNQVKFTAEGSPTAPAGCPQPAYIVALRPAWANPDPADIQISSANDATNGVATCERATNGAVTLTATTAVGSTTLKNTATLTCK